MGDRVYILSPDASAARRTRQVVGSSGFGAGVKVGTWLDLVEEARKAWLVPPPQIGWHDRAASVAMEMTKAYWAKSMAADQIGALQEVSKTLDLLLHSKLPDQAWDSDQLPERARARLADLMAIHQAMGSELPSDLAIANAIITADPSAALHRFPVIVSHGDAWLSPWQRALVARLNAKADNAAPADLVTTVASLGLSGNGHGDPGGPQHLAANLFSGTKGILTLGTGITVIAVRDAMEEAECLAGMVQRLSDSGLGFDQVGLVVPDDSFYRRCLADVFGLAGIPLAGLPDRTSLRDLGGELVRFVLMLHMGPPPKMAMASLLTSPLMPWSVDTGKQLAKRVIDGDFRLRPLPELDPKFESVLAIIRKAKGGHVSPVETLDGLARHAENSGVSDVHIARVRSLASEIAAIMPKVGEPDWDRMIRMAGRGAPVEERPLRFPMGAVNVFTEGNEPWAQCQHLFILGFSEGRYPSVPSPSASLLDGEAETINQILGWELPTVSSQTGSGRRILARQIAAASETVTFVIPQRDAGGGTLRPSDTMTFIARLADMEGDAIPINVHSPSAAKRIPRLATAKQGAPVLPKQPNPADIDMAKDLLAPAEGKEPRPISPSDLELLQVSPFAWLLRRLGAAPAPWEPDSMDPRIQGNLAHAVFETLFTVGGPLPDRNAIPDLVDGALAEAIRNQAPLVSGGMWKVERHALRSTLVNAATRWRDILEASGAQIVGAETWLQGTFAGVPIHGKADEVLSLPDGRIVVADLKKSASSKRKDRMKKGQDSQASLYRQMILTGGPKSGEGPLASVSSRDAGVLYFTLNDAIALVDEAAKPASPVLGIHTVTGDISGNALDEIRARLKEVRHGAVMMNWNDDADNLEDRGLPSSALTESPLVLMFAKPTATAIDGPGEDE